ncbi:MAG TPA: polysaccharide biosynthesis protein [Elusimicrobia bacterium]|nr:polysaccharide biosynthesis protein [Elusimicrobiota bacterium]HCE97585.1 polysaccharide biosynthesis protein [Elusimicrobiota bacterium]
MKVGGIIAFAIAFCACAAHHTQPAAPVTPGEQTAIEQRLLQTALDLKNKSQVNYKIQPGDLLEITVFQEADMSRTARISGNGTITFPLAGNLKLAELSVPEAESFLAEKLSEFLIKPQVTVLIKEYGNKQIYVLGEVKKPGSITLPPERRLTVLEAITLAGGFTDLAAPDRTKVLRNANGQNQKIPVEISRITKQGDKSADIFLEPNDTVFVPQSFF